MNKILRYSLVALMAMVMGNVYADDVTDVLTWEALGLDGASTSYKEFTDIKLTSNAVYAALASSGQGQYIQLRTKNSNEGIVTTASAGKVKSVKVAFNSKTTDRSIEIYGSNTAYTAAADLYDEAKAGTKLGSIAANEDKNMIVVEGDYTFVGLRSADGAIYVDQIEITWAGEGGSQEGGQVWDFTILPTQKIDATGNLEGNLGDAGVFVEDDGAAWQQVYNKAGLTDGTEFMATETEVFAPTKGLKWSTLENNKMVFYRNYPAAEGNNYGGKYLFFNKAAEVMIPAKAGQVIELVLASSKGGGTTKKITSQDVVETFDDGGGIKIEFPAAYEYNTYKLTAKVDNPYLAFESTICVQKITVKDAGSSEAGVIFSANPTEAWDAPAGAETEIPAANATIAGGKMFANNGQDDAKAMIKVQGGEAAFQCTNNNTFFKVVLDKALEAGDVISTRMQTRTDTELGLFFGADENRPSETTTAIVIPAADGQVWTEVPSYTVATGDAICGLSTFYIFRATAKSTYFNTFAITRGGATGISNVNVVRVSDGAIYNLAGQKVGKDYKGIVIQNGKKYMQK